jgi:hypothetical protein
LGLGSDASINIKPHLFVLYQNIVVNLMGANVKLLNKILELLSGAINLILGNKVM